MSETILTNARIVTADEVVTGTVVLREGRIASVESGCTALPGALDAGGDLLIPGLVELHTDNFERHLEPRPDAAWPALPALVQHDAELAAAGITTACDAVCIGSSSWCGPRNGRARDVLEALETAAANRLLRAEHRLHLRCETPAADSRSAFLPFDGHPLVALLSLMDHTPGERQWRDVDRARLRYESLHARDDGFDQALAEAPRLAREHAEANRRFFAAYARDNGLPLASHDDACVGHVAEAHAAGATICEFPTTLEAAREAKRLGFTVVMGAPNVVRGASHAGNVSALALAREGLLDVLSSDYVPGSLLHAAFRLVDDAGCTLPRAIAMVSLAPALALGFEDRGQIAPGKRADLVQVHVAAVGGRNRPFVRAVWRGGLRVA